MIMNFLLDNEHDPKALATLAIFIVVIVSYASMLFLTSMFLWYLLLKLFIHVEVPSKLEGD